MDDHLKGRIGLLGGTFDPIHFGHINLAFELLEKCSLEQIWFIPTHLSPLRAALASAQDRLKMVQLSIQSIPQFQVLDLELKRPPPSFTIDTVSEILSLHKEKRFALILGEDAIVQFKKWKEPEKLANLLPLLIGCRKGVKLQNQLSSLSFSPQIQAAIEKGIVETSLMEISATQIRERLQKKLYCGHLLPMKVLDYIYVNQLYFISK